MPTVFCALTVPGAVSAHFSSRIGCLSSTLCCRNVHSSFFCPIHGPALAAHSILQRVQTVTGCVESARRTDKGESRASTDGSLETRPATVRTQRHRSQCRGQVEATFDVTPFRTRTSSFFPRSFHASTAQMFDGAFFDRRMPSSTHWTA